MTWEELKQKAKEMRFNFYPNFDGCFFKGIGYNKRLYFFVTGEISLNLEEEGTHISITFSENRTPDQMLMIMRGLEKRKEVNNEIKKC